MRPARLAADDLVPQLEPLPPAWPGREVELDGTPIYVRDTPPRTAAAEPALYVHGLGGSSTNWTDLAQLLAGRFDAQAVDLPGFGFSGPARRYTIAAMADRVARYITAAGRGPVHLVGNSLGGAASVYLAGTRPDLIRTLTLISPALPFLDPRRSVQGRFVPLLFLPRASRIAARMMAAMEPTELTRAVIEAVYADPTRFPQERMAEAVEEARRRTAVPWYAEAYVGSLRGLVRSFVRAYLPGSGSIWRLAGRITAPTLVIGGRGDRLVDTRVPRQVAGVIPDSRLIMLDGVGHVAQMEAPRAVARAVIAMLDEVADRPAPRAAVPAPRPAVASPLMTRAAA